MLPDTRIALQLQVTDLLIPPDKLKSAGRRQAWERDEKNWSWNPFARGLGKRRVKTDVEAPDSQPSVTHANTSPVTYTNDFAHPENEGSLSQRQQTDEADDTEKATNTTDVPSTQDAIAESKTIDDEPGTEDDKDPNETKWKSFYRRMFLEGQVPWQTQVRQVLFPHWYTINWLLLLSPVGIGLHFVKGINPLASFVVNFIAIIPLAGILSFATEEIALRVGEVLGGLLNASFG
jgi:Ca2+:H+ antiporter